MISATVLALALMALTAGCGSADSANGPGPRSHDSSIPAATVSPVDNAGGGEIERSGASPGTPPEGALGSDSNRIRYSQVKSFDYVSLSIKGENLCAHPDVVKYRKPFNRFGIDAWYYTAYVIDDRDHDPNDGVEKLWGRPSTLVCSNPTGIIWPATAGPGGNGVSVSCPEFAPRADIETGAVFFNVTGQSGRADHMTQTAGGWGGNRDGLWNFKFHNWNANVDATPTLWLLCDP